MMLRHFLKTAFRNIYRNRIYSAVNIAGLAVGIAATLFITLWVIDEYGFDRFHDHPERTYLFFKKYYKEGQIEVNRSTPYLLGETAADKIPEIESWVRSTFYFTVLTNGKDYYDESAICVADSNFFRFFNYKFIKGNPASALSKPESMVITKSQALKYFGTVEAQGEQLTMENGDVYTITAIIEDMPLNTDIQDNIFVRITSVYNENILTDWTDHFFKTYFRIVEGADIRDINEKVTAVMHENMEESSVEMAGLSLKDLHLRRLDNQRGRIQYVYLISGIGLLLIIIACINYINIYTSISLGRSHEIGLRKVSGAKKGQIIKHFLGESLVQSVFAMILAISLVDIFRNTFNNLTGKDLLIPYTSLWFVLFLLFLLFFITFLAGFYPAFLVSSIRPADVFRDKVPAGSSISMVRKVLMGLQFTISAVLIIFTLMINRQIDYMVTRDLGFDKDNLISLSYTDAISRSYDAFRDDLLASPGIKNVSRTSNIPSDVNSLDRGLEWEGREATDELSAFGFIAADFDFCQTAGLRLKEGRFFSRDYQSDSSAYIINQRAAEYMGMDEPLGKMFATGSDPGPVIGVVENFNSLPMTYDYEPLFITIEPLYHRLLLIRISGGSTEEALGHINNVWDKYVSGVDFNPQFIDDQVERSYNNVVRIRSLSSAFTVLAIIITCIGLFGMASYTVRERSKEIKIRKVMGASNNEVMVHFTQRFIKLVLISLIISWPVSYLIVKNWMQSYMFRAGISIWIFIGSSLLIITIAVLSVSMQAIRAAGTSPAEGLGTQ